MRRYYLGLNAGGPRVSECLFTHGTSSDMREFSEYLGGKYSGAPMLCKNGRSALCLALKSYFDPGDRIIVTGFTCYAVYEAIRAAEMVPVFADIDPKDLNFDFKKLEKVVNKATKGIIVQNTLGNPIDIEKLERFAKKHKLIVIEDLAHSAGVKYLDRREAGTVGAAAVLSFGKDKSINTISGGAVVLRAPCKHTVEAPFKIPRLSDYLRARFYPLFCAFCKGLNYVHLGGLMMRFLIKIHFVERSADNKLDLIRKPAKFQAKLAMERMKKFHSRGEPVLRNFCLVRDREEVLAKLRESGYYFDSLWYEKPVSPARYYKKVDFSEKNCPVATKISQQIINFPKYYKKQDLMAAYKIAEPYLVGGEND